MYNPEEKKIITIKKIDNLAILPLGLWPYFPQHKFNKDIRRDNMDFIGNLFTVETDSKKRDQDSVCREGIKILTKSRSLALDVFTGFGKTTLAAWFICKLKVKTLIVCFLNDVNSQTFDNIQKFADFKIQFIKGKKFDLSANVYILGIKKGSNIDYDIISDLDIQLVIIDEVQIATRDCFCNFLFKVHPNYLIFLSATPYRADGLHMIMTPYFGEFNGSNYIKRSETKPFIVYKVQTLFQGEIIKVERFIHGRMVRAMDWNVFTASLCESKERQSYIADLALEHKAKRPLIISVRTEQSRGICSYLEAKGEIVGKLFENYGKRKARLEEMKKEILVVSHKRGSVGFDDPSRKVLILVYDCKDVAQAEGRIRDKDIEIFDIVDDHKKCEDHWELRKEWYETRGATIKIIGERKKGEVKSNSKYINVSELPKLI